MKFYTPSAGAVLAAWSIPYLGYPGGLNSINTAYTASLQDCRLYAQSFGDQIGVQWRTDTKVCKTYGAAVKVSAQLHCDPTAQVTWLETCASDSKRSPRGVCVAKSTILENCGPVPSQSGGKKRALTLDARIQAGEKLCAVPGYSPCPVGEKGGFECINTQSDLWSCGGCTYAGTSGQDCTSIPGVDSVSCQAGTCVVESCQSDYNLSGNKSFCSRNKNAPAVRRSSAVAHIRI